MSKIGYICVAAVLCGVVYYYNMDQTPFAKEIAERHAAEAAVQAQIKANIDAQNAAILLAKQTKENEEKAALLAKQEQEAKEQEQKAKELAEKNAHDAFMKKMFFGRDPRNYSTEFDDNPDHYRILNAKLNIHMYYIETAGISIIFAPDGIIGAREISLDDIRKIGSGAKFTPYSGDTKPGYGMVVADTYDAFGQFCRSKFEALYGTPATQAASKFPYDYGYPKIVVECLATQNQKFNPNVYSIN